MTTLAECAAAHSACLGLPLPEIEQQPAVQVSLLLGVASSAPAVTLGGRVRGISTSREMMWLD